MKQKFGFGTKFAEHNGNKLSFWLFKKVTKSSNLLFSTFEGP